MCPRLRPLLSGLYSFVPKRSFRGIGQILPSTNLRSGNCVLKHPRFIDPRPFLRSRLKIGIYTDACAMSPFEKGPINWKSGIGIGRNSSYKRRSRRIPLARNRRQNPTPLVKRNKPPLPHRLIIFFELLGAYIVVRLWTPKRLRNNDLLRSEIPIASDDLWVTFLKNDTHRPDEHLGRCKNWMSII